MTLSRIVGFVALVSDRWDTWWHELHHPKSSALINFKCWVCNTVIIEYYGASSVRQQSQIHQLSKIAHISWWINLLLPLFPLAKIKQHPILAALAWCSLLPDIFSHLRFQLLSGLTVPDKSVSIYYHWCMLCFGRSELPSHKAWRPGLSLSTAIPLNVIITMYYYY